jgi:hypothetical protein
MPNILYKLFSLDTVSEHGDLPLPQLDKRSVVGGDALTDSASYGKRR